MAKISEQKANIKVSKLVRNSDDNFLSLLDDEILQSIQDVIQQLLGDQSIIVEVEVDNSDRPAVSGKKEKTILHG